MKIELVKEFRLRIPRPEGEQSRELPRQDLRLLVAAQSEIDLQSQTGEVIDYRAIEEAVGPLIDPHDQAYLEGVESLSPEAISQQIHQRLTARLPGLSAVVVQEAGAR